MDETGRSCIAQKAHFKDTVPKIWKKIFSERKLRGPGPNFYIHISVSNLYIPTIGLPTWLQQIKWTGPGNI
jgi:hypothetical protein